MNKSRERALFFESCQEDFTIPYLARSLSHAFSEYVSSIPGMAHHENVIGHGGWIHYYIQHQQGSTQMTDTFQVCYRTGGTKNYVWKLCLPVRTWKEAFEQAELIERGGRKAIISRTKYWEACGLPEGWDVG